MDLWCCVAFVVIPYGFRDAGFLMRFPVCLQNFGFAWAVGRMEFRMHFKV